jgi:hypothetical protein
MKKLIFTIVFAWLTNCGFGQESNQLLETIIEQIAEESEEELDYAELYEALYYFSENRINLNKTSKEELSQLYILNAYQIDKLMVHIEKNGKLLSYLELQTVAGFDVQTIQHLLPFTNVSASISSKQLFSNIKQYVILRDQFFLQKQKGYQLDEQNKTHYLGNKHRTYMRYRLKNKHLQAGITAEKDAGESFFGVHQPYGFDFYSAHLQAKKLGKIRNMILGDYQLNFGQGLVMQSGMSFGKSSEVINIQKSGNLIKAHTAAAENLFFRGAAMQMQALKNLEIIAFFSANKVDANITDTLENEEFVFSSIQGSGLHRTERELLDKNIILQNHFGGHIKYNYKQFNLGVSSYTTKIEGDYQKNIYPYNQFDFSGNSNQNLGFDYHFLYKNMNFFGELARSENGAIAHVNGLMLGLDKTLSASLLYRDFAKDYQSVYANPFAEGDAQNEKGVYMGLEYRPNHKLKIKGYVDNYQFPWLRFGVDAPSKGNDFLLQSDYKISRTIKMYARYKSERKEDGITASSAIRAKRKDNFRFHINYKEGESWAFANRFESTIIHFNNQKENGYMLYQDVKYKPLFSKLTFSSRYVLFNTPTYDSRIYAYENDVLYGYSIPSYYGKGSKIYVVAKCNIFRNLDTWLRIAHTKFTDREVLKSGWDEIDDNKMTEVKVQLRYKF